AGLEADPPPRLEAPLSQRQGEISRALRALARAEAERRDMSQELLARKRDVEGCIRHFEATGELSEAYSGWREALVGEPFRRVLARLAGQA
ncbi:MAG: hypothetical protein PVF57_05240, partial [Pseudomonadales bacterium]